MTNEQVLRGKTVFVIGGGSGIGLATALQADRAGASIILGGNDRQQLDAAGRSFKEVRIVELDITVRQSVEATFSVLPRLDHLVVTAGRRIKGAIAETDPDYLLQAVHERVGGAVYAVRAALPLLAEDASVTLTSGLLGQRPLAPGNATFAASVGGVDALVRGLAMELKPVRVNAVAPGVTDSTLFVGVDPQIRDAFFRQAKARTLVNCLGTVDQMASAYIFLMCNGYVSGHILHVDGGAQIS